MVILIWNHHKVKPALSEVFSVDKGAEFRG